MSLFFSLCFLLFIIFIFFSNKKSDIIYLCFSTFLGVRFASKKFRDSIFRLRESSCYCESALKMGTQSSSSEIISSFLTSFSGELSENKLWSRIDLQTDKEKNNT